MGTSSGGVNKAYWQRKIDDTQRTINRLKAENARDRESMKLNNSRRNSNNAPTLKSRIAQRTEEVKKYQQQIKHFKEEKARASKYWLGSSSEVHASSPSLPVTYAA